MENFNVEIEAHELTPAEKKKLADINKRNEDKRTKQLDKRNEAISEMSKALKFDEAKLRTVLGL